MSCEGGGEILAVPVVREVVVVPVPPAIVVAVEVQHVPVAVRTLEKTYNTPSAPLAPSSTLRAVSYSASQCPSALYQVASFFEVPACREAGLHTPHYLKPRVPICKRNRKYSGCMDTGFGSRNLHPRNARRTPAYSPSPDFIVSDTKKQSTHVPTELVRGCEVQRAECLRARTERPSS